MDPNHDHGGMDRKMEAEMVVETGLVVAVAVVDKMVPMAALDRSGRGKGPLHCHKERRGAQQSQNAHHENEPAPSLGAASAHTSLCKAVSNPVSGA